ncbi:MAG: ribonuclease H-like domain-containing protein [Deltaproteobacteria bacterium]|nr:ribonuclease H-like domain-containing protein [Deltaproteobacteria bacterium]
MTPIHPIPMLEQTFIHVSGIGPKTESAIWEKGIHTWTQFLDHPGPVLSETRDPLVRQHLRDSLDHRHDIGYFSDRLPAREMWRLFSAFRDRAVYLDIETCPVSYESHDITVIGLYDGVEVETFVNGRNLDDFEMAIARYDLVITFNGTTFDLPFIHRSFPSISLPPAHIDLRFVLRKLGYRGGLKKIEQDVGICRDAPLMGMSGYEAVMLWKAHQWGIPAALDTLVAYNTADIVNLEPLMKMAERKMKQMILAQPSADPIR